MNGKHVISQLAVVGCPVPEHMDGGLAFWRLVNHDVHLLPVPAVSPISKHPVIEAYSDTILPFFQTGFHANVVSIEEGTDTRTTQFEHVSWGQPMNALVDEDVFDMFFRERPLEFRFSCKKVHQKSGY
jgi:hypothetical protein